MPGLVGFLSDKIASAPDLTQILAGELAFSSSQLSLNIRGFSQKGQLALNSIQTDKAELVLWGDVFAIDGLSVSNSEALQRFQTAYFEDALHDVLGITSGYFILVIQDMSASKILIASDKLGMKPLYLWQTNNRLHGFASELKALLLHQQFDISIAQDAVDCFSDIGHYLALDTAFEGVTRFAPAAICEFDLEGNQLSSSQYWNWTKIDFNTKINFPDALSKMGQMFEQAMERSLSKVDAKDVAITLSGGLDSRVLLAATKKFFQGNIHTFTFGEVGCQDQAIAQQVAEIAGANHHFIEINQSNWFAGREEGVWNTDGLKNILHMHALKALESITSASNYLLNGFLGDVTAGGSYLAPLSAHGPSAVEIKFKKHALKAQFSSNYFGDNQSDAVLIYNRGVRFISAGSDLLATNLHQLKPFVENDFLEFMYSLPESYRRDGRIYHHMLLELYPDYFSTIPWQQTGKPISKDVKQVAVVNVSLKSKIKNLLIGSPLELAARRLYRKFSQKHHYVAYDTWLREPSFKAFAQSLILNEHDQLFNALSPKKRRVELFKAYYSGDPQVKAESIGGLLTLAIFSKQLQEAKKKATT